MKRYKIFFNDNGSNKIMQGWSLPFLEADDTEASYFDLEYLIGVT